MTMRSRPRWVASCSQTRQNQSRTKLNLTMRSRSRWVAPCSQESVHTRNKKAQFDALLYFVENVSCDFSREQSGVCLIRSQQFTVLNLDVCVRRAFRKVLQRHNNGGTTTLSVCWTGRVGKACKGATTEAQQHSAICWNERAPSLERMFT